MHIYILKNNNNYNNKLYFFHKEREMQSLMANTAIYVCVHVRVYACVCVRVCRCMGVYKI